MARNEFKNQTETETQLCHQDSPSCTRVQVNLGEHKGGIKKHQVGTRKKLPQLEPKDLCIEEHSKIIDSLQQTTEERNEARYPAVVPNTHYK